MKWKLIVSKLVTFQKIYSKTFTLHSVTQNWRILAYLNILQHDYCVNKTAIKFTKENQGKVGFTFT